VRDEDRSRDRSFYSVVSNERVLRWSLFPSPVAVERTLHVLPLPAGRRSAPLFKRSVTKCSFVASPNFAPLLVAVNPREGNRRGVFVAFENVAGERVQSGFSVQVQC
jgi:hypothetical protein